MKFKSIFLTMLVLLSLGITGCATSSNHQPTVVRNLEVKYIQVPLTVDIPEIDCDFTGEGLEPSVKLLNCVVLQKRVIDSIKEVNENAKKEYQEAMSKLKN